MRKTLVHLIVVTVALGAAAWMLPGIGLQSVPALLVGGLVLAAVNAWIRPIMVFLTFPLTVFTFGLLLFVVNGVAFALAAWLVPGFSVAGFGWAILGAAVVSLLSLFLSGIVEDPPERTVRSH
jgi:putative membrane protein